MAPDAQSEQSSNSGSFDENQVDNLLREAEQRLSGQSAVLESSNSVSNPICAQIPSPQQPPDHREKLAVRQPQPTRVETKDTAGSNWFNLPKTNLTSEMKRDWQILRMRNVLDPKQQRKTLRAEPPKYSQVGEIVAGPTDFYSARLTRKERKNNLLQEAFSEYDETKFRHKYAGIQKDKTSGKKAFYKKLVSQRRKNKR